VKVHSHFKLSSFGRTWVFDAATKKWHEEAWYDTNGVQHRTLDTFKAYAYGTNVSLDWKTGALYQRDTTNFTDNGVACVYSHDFPHLLDQEDSRVSPYALLVEDIEGHAADANDPPERTQSEWRRTVCLFLLGSKGSVLMKEHGLSLTHPQLAGQDMSVPKAICSLLGPAL
jgi:hypothetical protein